MVIIFEGPDNVGKSTQIDMLRKAFHDFEISTQVIHCSNFKFRTNIDDKYSIETKTKVLKEMSKRYYTKIMHIMNVYNTKDDNYESVLILDRSHLGETVYSPIYRNYSGDYVYELENIVEHPKKVFVITLVDKAENLISREDGHSFSTNIDQKNKEIEYFKEANSRTKFNSLLIDVDGLNPDRVFEKISNFVFNDRF